MSRTKISCIIALVVLILAIFQLVNERIFWGIRVNGINIGGLTLDEATLKLKSAADLLEQRTIDVSYEKSQWTLNPKLIGVKADLQQTLKNAYDIGRKGNLAERIKELYISMIYGRNLTLMVKVDDRKLARVLNTLSREIHVSPRNAELKITGLKVKLLRDGIEGRELLIKETKSRLEAVLAKGGDKVSLAVLRVKPSLNEEIFNQIRTIGVVASFNTKFDPTEAERTKNIEIAAESIRGYVIEPGEVFSFNRAVGPRSEEEGYKKAMVIINNKFVPDWGGGVCQVSTTLYNAALLADMDIPERREHSRPVKYIGPGRGSTVAYGLIDLKIRNPMAKPVVIWTEGGDGNLTIYFLGEKVAGKEVVIESADYQEIIPNDIARQSNLMARGQELVEEEGSGGYQVTTWRVVKQNGKVLRRELIAKDRVEAIDRVVIVGVKETPP